MVDEVDEDDPAFWEAVFQQESQMMASLTQTPVSQPASQAPSSPSGAVRGPLAAAAPAATPSGAVRGPLAAAAPAATPAPAPVPRLPAPRLWLGALPGSLTRALMPFQVDGVAFCVERNGRALIADEMGCGKTITAISK